MTFKTKINYGLDKYILIVEKYNIKKELIMKVNFLIVGTQKGGTTALSKFIGQHPEVCFYIQNKKSNFYRGKEPHFFDNEELFKISPPPYDLYHRMFPDPKDAKIIGECTPIYMYWQPAAERIYSYNPDIKLIAILRNPVERAFSHYVMMKNEGVESLSFSEAIRLEGLRISSYIDRGYYAKQIKRLLLFFPTNQMLFLKSEELINNHQSTLQKVFKFLDIKEDYYVKPEIVFDQKYGEMDIDDRKFLSEKFREDIDDLEELLGWDCSTWRK